MGATGEGLGVLLYAADSMGDFVGGCFKYEISILPSSYIQICVDGELLVWWAYIFLYAIRFVFFFNVSLLKHLRKCGRIPSYKSLMPLAVLTEALISL